MSEHSERIRAIVRSHGGCESGLIAILQDIQTEFGYLSEESMTEAAAELGISTAKVYSVATFYENFSLEPKGKYILRVCAGTACHVRRSEPIYNALREELGLQGKRHTSADGLFTLETVACLGACSLAPAMTVNGEVHGAMTPEKALALLGELRKEARHA